MKSKNNAKSFLNKALTNKYVLYVVAFIAFLSLLQHIMSKEFTAVILFYLVGLVTYYYSKNMTLVLGVSFLATLFADLVKGLFNIREGFKENLEDPGQGHDSSGNLTCVSSANCPPGYICSDASLCIIPPQPPPNPQGDGDGFTNLKQKASRSGYQNQKKLNPSLYNMPNKEQMKKQLGDASELESAYDDLEKVIGDNGIKSLSGNTENLIKKQNKLMKQMKEITPALQTAMESVSKIDLGKISNLMTNIGND